MKACVEGLQNGCKMLPRSLIEPISQEHGTQALLLGTIVSVMRRQAAAIELYCIAKLWMKYKTIPQYIPFNEFHEVCGGKCSSDAKFFYLVF